MNEEKLEENSNKINFKNTIISFFGIIILTFFYLAYSKATISLNENKEVLNILKYSQNYLNYLNEKTTNEELKKLEKEIIENPGYKTLSFFKKEADINSTFLMDLISEIKLNNEEKIYKEKVKSLLDNIIMIINNNYEKDNTMTIKSYNELISLIKNIDIMEEDMMKNRNQLYLKERINIENNKINNEIKTILKQ